MQQQDLDWLLTFPQQQIDINRNRLAFRKVGQGTAVLLVHGWPFNSLSYASLARKLAPQHTCYLVDLPGCGDTEWRATTDFTFPGQAQTLKQFAAALGLTAYDVVAHDTGASISRLLAIADPDHLQKLVLFNTEIPGQRPPNIPLSRALMFLPFSTYVFQRLFQNQAIYRHAFRDCFYDRDLLGGTFQAAVITPTVTSFKRMQGLSHYLRGLDWGVIDGLREVHPNIAQPTLLIWGANDPTFPLQHARKMATQFANLKGFVEIEHAKLLVYIECAAEAAPHILNFLGTATDD